MQTVVNVRYFNRHTQFSFSKGTWLLTNIFFSFPENTSEEGVILPTRKEMREEMKSKLETAMMCGQRIRVDLSMENTMTTKVNFWSVLFRRCKTFAFILVSTNSNVKFKRHETQCTIDDKKFCPPLRWKKTVFVCMEGMTEQFFFSEFRIILYARDTVQIILFIETVREWEKWSTVLIILRKQKHGGFVSNCLFSYDRKEVN